MKTIYSNILSSFNYRLSHGFICSVHVSIISSQHIRAASCSLLHHSLPTIFRG